MDLIEQLRIKQADMSQANFATRLGISDAMLSLVYSGKRQIGTFTARCIVREYPDLRWLVAGYLMEESNPILK